MKLNNNDKKNLIVIMLICSLSLYAHGPEISRPCSCPAQLEGNTIESDDECELDCSCSRGWNPWYKKEIPEKIVRPIDIIGCCSMGVCVLLVFWMTAIGIPE